MNLAFFFAQFLTIINLLICLATDIDKTPQIDSDQYPTISTLLDQLSKNQIIFTYNSPELDTTIRRTLVAINKIPEKDKVENLLKVFARVPSVHCLNQTSQTVAFFNLVKNISSDTKIDLLRNLLNRIDKPYKQIHPIDTILTITSRLVEITCNEFPDPLFLETFFRQLRYNYSRLGEETLRSCIDDTAFCWLNLSDMTNLLQDQNQTQLLSDMENWLTRKFHYYAAPLLQSPQSWSIPQQNIHNIQLILAKDTTLMQCTGFLLPVDDKPMTRFVITARHCILNEFSREFKQTWMIYPEHNISVQSYVVITQDETPMLGIPREKFRAKGFLLDIAILLLDHELDCSLTIPLWSAEEARKDPRNSASLIGFPDGGGIPHPNKIHRTRLDRPRRYGCDPSVSWPPINYWNGNSGGPLVLEYSSNHGIVVKIAGIFEASDGKDERCLIFTKFTPEFLKRYIEPLYRFALEQAGFSDHLSPIVSDEQLQTQQIL